MIIINNCTVPISNFFSVTTYLTLLLLSILHWNLQITSAFLNTHLQIICS